MSASLISTARARLSAFQDATHLVHELIGGYSLTIVRLADDTSDSSKDTFRTIARQLLVKLKIIFDYQLSFFVLQHFEQATLSSSGLNLPDRDFCFEATLYTLYRGANIEHPATLGESEYRFHRGVAFAAFLSIFRGLCLHHTHLSDEEERSIRQRVGRICQVWETHKPLSVVEGFVLREVVPQTLDEIQVQNGNCALQTFCCGKCDQEGYLEGRAVICIDPSNPQYRSDSLQCCQDLFLATIDDPNESNFTEAFWTLHDINWCVMVAALQLRSIANDPSSEQIIRMSARFWDKIKTRSHDLDSNSRNGVLCAYFADAANHLRGNNDILFPASAIESNDSKQNLNTDIVGFERDLTLRCRIDLNPAPDGDGSSSEIKEVTETQDVNESPIDNEFPMDEHRPIPLPKDFETSGPHQYSVNGSKPQNIVIPVEDGLTNGLSDRRLVGESPVDPTQEDFITVAVDPESVELGNQNEQPLSYTNMSKQIDLKQAQTEKIKPLHSPPTTHSPPLNHLEHTSDRNSPSTSYTSPSEGRGGFSPNSKNSSSWQSGWSEQSGPGHHGSSPRSTSRISPLSSPFQNIVSPTPIAPIIEDSGLQVVDHEERDTTTPLFTESPRPLESPHPDYFNYAHARYQSPTPTPTYAPSEISSKASATKLAGFFRFRKRSTPTSGKSIPTEVPEDLSFCFSAVGTSLVLWKRRNAEHLVKLHWPFQGGHKLPLRPPLPHSAMSWHSNFNVRLVAAGNQLVAVVINEDKHYRLFFFNQQGQRFEIHLQDTTVLPTTLTISRDDSKIAVCCGGTVFLYEVTNNTARLMGPLPAHSRGSNLPANRRLQQANFSLDSTVLVIATQEYHGGEASSYQVHVSLWRCMPLSSPVFEVELDPVVLSLGYGNDPGLSGIFCSIDHDQPANSRVFLAAQTTKPYEAILMPAKAQKNKRLSLKEKSIDAVAQAPDLHSNNSSTINPHNPSVFFGSHYVFKNGRHDLCLLDIRTGAHHLLASFAHERSGLKLEQEAMAVAFPNETLALAFWKSWRGDLVLKQVDLNPASGKPGMIHTVELKDVFYRVNMMG